MLEIFLTASVAFVVSFLAIPVVIEIADRKKLYDVPDERKLHTHTIASLGGVGIFIGFIFAGLIGINIKSHPEFQYFIASVLIIFFIGLKDDLIVISATKKFIAQIIAAAIIIHLGGIRIESFYGFMGIHEVDSMYGVPLTYFVIILITNAFNLIDGIDGLAASLGLMSLLLLSVYFFYAGMTAYSMFAIGLAGSLLAFLIFNTHPAQIFMGDSGSLVIGVVMAILVLKFVQVGGAVNAVIPVPSVVAISIVLLLVPLMDTLRVFSIRIFRRRSPFSPDRNHVHHLLLDRGYGHTKVAIICVLSNLVLIIAIVVLRSIGNTILVPALFLVSFSFLGYLYYSLPKRKRQLSSRDIRKDPKIITLNTTDHRRSEQIGGGK